MLNVEWNTIKHTYDYNQWGELLAGVRGYIYNPVDNQDIYYRTSYMSDEELNWINNNRCQLKANPLPRLARDIEGFKIVPNKAAKMAHEKATFVNIDYNHLIDDVKEKLAGKFSVENYLKAEPQELDF